MLIALTHNTAPDTGPEYAPEETVKSLASSLEGLGHEVVPVEVSGPAGEICLRLTGLRPDLVFTIAEGPRGGWRQAFYPTLFDDLRLPYTGSDARGHARALDKHVTKLMASARGVRTPRWLFAQHANDVNQLAGTPLDWPVIIKPNFEGWSRGISDDSLATSLSEARHKAEELLHHFPDGILIEEYIPGLDLTVPFLEAADNDFHGMLAPLAYARPAGTEHSPVLGYDLKSVSGPRPVQLTDNLDHTIRRMAHTAVTALGCRDLARVDFRLAPDNTPYLLEVNSAPSLSPGRRMDTGAKTAGINAAEAVLTSAARRNHLPL